MIEELISLLKVEKDLAVKEVQEKATLVLSKVYPLDGFYLIDCYDSSRFKPGDVVGTIKDGELVNLGVVVDKFERKMIVSSYTDIDVGDDYVYVFPSENMIGYDLQIALLRRLLDEENADYRELMAKDVVFGSMPMPPIDIRKKIIGMGLDIFQREAVESILNLDDGELVLIIGPPGTGKTRVISRAAIELADMGERVLITSHTNRAVDAAIERISPTLAVRVGWPDRVSENTRRHLLEAKVREKLGDRLRTIEAEISKIKKRISKGRINALKERLDVLYRTRQEIIRRAEREVLDEVKIVGTTLIKSGLKPLSKQEFDTVLIDESSQVSISLALLGMVKARKYVLVGDHHQLLPVFRSVRNSRRYSVFIHLKKKYPHRVRWLKRHYRSNSKIVSLTKFFYEEEIQPAESCGQVILRLKRDVPEPLSPLRPIVFIWVDGCEKKVRGSRINVLEAEVCKYIINELVEAGVPESEIACISPYKAQVELLKNIVTRSVEIGTVDAFQGREKDVVIYSVTSTSDFWFAANPNRLNVAFSRPKKKLIVVGNARAIMRYNTVLKRFLEFCLVNQAVFHIHSPEVIA